MCMFDVHQSVLIQSVSQWVVWPLSLSLPLLSPLPSLSPCVCACSSQCVRRCCGSSRGSSFVETACRWGVDGQPRWCGHGLCPWRSAGRELLPSVSVTGSCVEALDCRSLSHTDLRRRPRWLQEVAATSAFVLSAGASRDSGCVLEQPQGPSLLPRTVRKV